MTRQYAVIGASVEESLSPWIHRCFANQLGLALEYRAISVPSPDFEATVHRFFAQGGSGLNITTPYKERAYALADSRSSRAESAKAANILFYKQGKLYADNSDGAAFWRDIELESYLPQKTPNILLLGAGGAARAIASASPGLSLVKLLLWNRNAERARRLQSDFLHTSLWVNSEECYPDVIVNTLPPNTSIDVYRQFTVALQPCLLAYDISYFPRETPFMHFAASYCKKRINGLGMLVLQAADSLKQWMPSTNPDPHRVMELLKRQVTY